MGTRTSGSSISTPILFLSMYLISAPALRTCVKYKRFTSHTLESYYYLPVAILFLVKYQSEKKKPCNEQGTCKIEWEKEGEEGGLAG